MSPSVLCETKTWGGNLQAGMQTSGLMKTIYQTEGGRGLWPLCDKMTPHTLALHVGVVAKKKRLLGELLRLPMS